MKKIYLLLFTFIAAQANSQIVYNDITDMQLTPAPAPNGMDYPLDIDGDGTDDFVVNMMGDLQAGYGNFEPANVSAMNGAIEEAVWGDAMKLSAGTSIDANSLTWTSTSANTNPSGTSLPIVIWAGGASYAQEWLAPVTDGYFGFKFEINGSLHYGWMRIDVPDNAIEFTIKDWAYNAVADEPILAGQTTGQVASIESKDDNVSVLQMQNQISIEVTNETYSQYKMYDLAGKEISTNSFNQKATINTSNLNSGIYIVNLIGEEKTYQQKLMIK